MAGFTRALLKQAGRDHVIAPNRFARVEDILWWCFDRAEADARSENISD